jgi:hypothetical protein
MRESDKTFGQMRKDQIPREGELHSKFVGGAGEFGDLEDLLANSDVRRNELLFKLTNQIEDAKSALKQAEQLADRWKKRVAELEGMYRILTKK